ncbi:MAG: VOC family protein [Alphaproteobacteria bacterium]|nr:VOC family protein [Alphaproteobacteria bacterium]
MTITRHCLRVTNAAELEAFYTHILGMRNFGTPGAPLLGFDPHRCLLELQSGATRAYEPTPTDPYWKTGITVRNLDHAARSLKKQGWPVSEPHQFRDIGYLCHLHDPQGFTIELLQQGFEGREKAVGAGHAIGGQATLAHITLRVSDITRARTLCEDTFGLRLLSIQPVPEHGFCLYFYSADSESPPYADLEAVDNREWLWERPYALLELQHVFGRSSAPFVAVARQAGFTGFSIRRGLDNGVTRVKIADLESMF